MCVCLFLMKVLFNACLAILLSDAQWKWESKIQAYTASKPGDVHTKSGKIIWRNNFFDLSHQWSSQGRHLPQQRSQSAPL